MRARLAILGLLGLLSLAALVCVHARWLAVGPRDARFVRFLRRYDRRANLQEVIPPHGVAVDRRGARLDVAEPGSTLQHAIDDLALAADDRPVPLTLDARLQARAEALMEGKSGAVVALEPTTGRIRALVSAPRANYLNRALNGLYPPGSTFKVFMAAAALSQGVDPVFNCPAEGYRSARGAPAIRDVEARQMAWRGKAWRGFGRLGMGEALMHSSNTYFAQLGVALGAEAFGRAVTAARLRDPVVVLSSSAVSVESAGGGVPDGLSSPQLAPVAIGQGALQLTPLAVALFTAAVADDGLMLAPTLSPAAKPALRARAFDFAAAARVKKMMRAVVRGGTARACDIAGLDVCAKTGTAETGTDGADHAWFTCFAPEAAPRLVVTVVVERGGFGAAAALPVAKGVLLEARNLGYFE
ncbi:MAG: penicillin-binding transpeptidase domain-containing protein [Kiritimatiellia bacterium]